MAFEIKNMAYWKAKNGVPLKTTYGLSENTMKNYGNSRDVEKNAEAYGLGGTKANPTRFDGAEMASGFGDKVKELGGIYGEAAERQMLGGGTVIETDTGQRDQEGNRIIDTKSQDGTGTYLGQPTQYAPPKKKKNP